MSIDARRAKARFDDGGLVLSVALSMLALHLVWRGVVTFDSYFWQDDFRYLADARVQGLSADYLFQDYNGHVMPGQFLLVWAISHLEFTFTVPALMLMGLQTLASALMLWVFWLLWPGRPEILVGYAIYLFSPLGLVAVTWWAAGLQALPLQAAMLLALGACIKDHRSPSLLWRSGTVVAILIGLAFWQKSLLIIPLLILVQVLLLEGAKPREWRSVVRRHRWTWTVWLMVGLAYAVVYVVLVGRGEAPEGDRPSLRTFLVNAVVKTLLPGVLGGPWTDRGGENTVYPAPENAALTLAVLTFAGFAWWAWRRQPAAAVRAGLLVAAYLVMDLGLVLLARSDFALLLARDPRYVTDALPVVAIGVVAAVAPPAWDPPPRLTWTPQTNVVRVVMTVCAGLVASSWLSVQAVSGQLSHEYSQQYVSRLLHEYDALPGAVMVNASAPPVGVVAQPVSVIFGAAGVPVRVDEPSADLRMANGFGSLVRVSIPNAESRATGPEPGCGWTTTVKPVRVRTTAGPPGLRRVVQLGYFAGSDSGLLLGLNDEEPRRYVPAPRGLGQLALVTDEPVSTVSWARPAGAAKLCVTDVAVGAPWPAD